MASAAAKRSVPAKTGIAFVARRAGSLSDGKSDAYTSGSSSLGGVMRSSRLEMESRAGDVRMPSRGVWQE